MPSTTTSRATVVAAHELTKRFGSGPAAVDALRGVDIDFAAGSFTAIMGPSGSGKSTLLHLLAGLDRPTSGWSEIDGTRIDRLSDRELTILRRERVGFVFQSFNLLPVLTALQNVELPVRIGGHRPDSAWVDELLTRMGVSECRDRRPTELSGGQQQRVAVARALVTRPAVVFADEPTGNLDSVSSQEVLAVMREAVDDLGQTTLMVTHDARAAAVADRVVFLADGCIVDSLEAPTPDEILDRLKALA